eukprot:comp19850_c0_seq1/m.23938 comp19850_c0_seq1/g.23938  ORF comp19850_c0_seq1/g.23938 comp19850_c0_seq1/m.23938 type:complete len:1095 (-) comp19850_c0_seq1:379-3663(-)
MDLPSFALLLHQLSNPASDIRQGAEAQFEALKQSPDTLAQLMVSTIAQSDDALARETAAVLFRRIFFHVLVSEELLWASVNQDIRNGLRAHLLQCFQTEPNASLRKKICSCVSSVAKAAGDPIPEKWPELLPSLFQMVQSNTQGHLLAAFQLLAGLPSIFGNQLQHYSAVVHDLLARALAVAQTDPELALAGLDALVALLISLETFKDQKPFADVVPDAVGMTAMYAAGGAAAEAHTSQAAKLLVDLMATAPKLFDGVPGDIVMLAVTHAGNTHTEEDIRKSFTELAVSMCEQRSAVMRKVPNVAGLLCPLFMGMMAEIEDDSIEEWSQLDEPEMDFENDSFPVLGEESLDRITNSLGGKTVYPVASQLLSQMLHQSNWQHRYAALMGLSAIGEGCRKQMSAQLDTIIPTVLPFTSDPHPRVRYAACNALGQMATDFSPDVQNRYLAQIMPALLTVMADPNARVQAHAAAAVINVVEGIEEKEHLGPHMDALLTALYRLLGSERMIVQEQALRTTAVIADISEESFAAYCPHFMEPLFALLQAATGPNQRLLRGKTLECASLIGLAVGKAAFSNYGHRLMQLILAVHPDEWTADDPQNTFALEAIVRMCRLLEREFLAYLPALMPFLLRTAQLKADVAIVDTDDADAKESMMTEGYDFIRVENQHVGIQTAVLEDKASACEVLSMLASVLGADYAPWLEQTAATLMPLVRFYMHEGVRQAATSAMPALLQCAAAANLGPEAFSKAWETVAKQLLPAIHHEPESFVLPDMLAALRQCIQVVSKTVGVPVFTPEQTKKLSDGLRHQIQATMTRAHRRKLEKAEEDDEETGEERDEAAADEGILRELADLVRVFFQAEKQMALPFFDSIVDRFATMAQPTRPSSEREWAMCVFAYVIESAGPEGWRYHEVFLRPIIEGLSDEAQDVRHSAAFAVGVIAQFGGEAAFPLAAEALPRLEAMIGQPDARDDEIVFSTENAISAITKIMAFGPTVASLDVYIPRWLGWLPIEFDSDECFFVYSFLCQLIESNDARVLGPNNSHVPHLTQVLALAVEKNCLGDTSANLKPRVISILGHIRQQFPDTWNSLPVELQNAVAFAN